MWKKVLFKDKEVWAKANTAGELLVNNGLASIRYSESDTAKVYRGAASKIQPLGGEQIKEQDARKKLSLSALGNAKTRTEAQKTKAKGAAQELIDSFPANAVTCFTDGSCQGNPGPAGLGVLIHFPDGSDVEHYRYLGKATNNVAELSALLDAITLVTQRPEYDNSPIHLLTDSKYSHGVLTLNWKAKANRPLIAQIKKMMRERGGVRIHWVAGHAGIEGNERADQLANLAIEEGK